MNTSPVNKNLFEGAIVDAIDSALTNADNLNEDEFAVRAVFGLERTSTLPDQETYQRMMEVIMDAAIKFVGRPVIDIEKAAQDFLRGRLMELHADTDVSRCGVRMAATYEHGDITYISSASLAYGSSIPSPHLDTAIAEARRREGYDAANKPMVLIEPPKVEEGLLGDIAAQPGETVAEADDDIPF